MKRLPGCAFAALLLSALLSACGGGGSSAVPDCPASATCAVLDQDGGLLAADDASAIAGAELELPRGAIDQARTFSLRSVDVDVAGAVGPVVEIGPSGTQFDPAAVLRLPYSAERVPDGYRLEQLRVAKLLEAGRLQVLPPTAEPLRDQRLQALTSSLSQFVVVLPDAPGIPQAPVADAGADQTVRVGDTITLDGGASRDINGDSLQFAWRLLSHPVGSEGLLSGADGARPRLLIDQAGVYELSLIVSDGLFESTADTVTLATDNSPPVAVPGPDQTITPGDTVQLDGSGSQDPDGDPLNYRWTATAPDGAAVALSDPAGVRPHFVAGQAGRYQIQLIANDGRADSAPAELRIGDRNSPPVARAGRDRRAATGEIIQLDGSSSHDVDGDALAFHWTLLQQPSGQLATFSDAAAPQPELLIPVAGDYLVQLSVSDGTQTATDTLLISDKNLPPLADAGPDQFTPVNTVVALDGSGSADADDEVLSYRWSLSHQPPGSAANISNPRGVSAQLQTDIAGDYVAQLTVVDAQQQAASDTVLISQGNLRPVAQIGDFGLLEAGSLALADGRASNDPNGDALSFSWSLLLRPKDSAAQLEQTETAQIGLIADQPGDYLIQLIVSDGTLNSHPATRLFRVNPAVQLSPTPNPVPSQNPAPAIGGGGGGGGSGGGSPPVPPATSPTGTPTPTPAGPVVDLSDRRVVSGTAITLPQPSCDTSASCSWRITEQPADSDARLRDLGDGNVALDATVVGDYLLQFGPDTRRKLQAKNIRFLKIQIIPASGVQLRSLHVSVGCTPATPAPPRLRGCIQGLGLGRF